MNNLQSQEILSKELRTLRFIWWAMLGSLAVYLFVCLQFEDALHNPQGLEFPLDVIKNVLCIVVAIEILLVSFFRRFILKAVQKNDATNNSNANPLARYTLIVVISLAIADSIGIYGLVLFMIGADFQILYIFLFLAALMMFWHRPKVKEYEELVNNMRNSAE
ncbi:hypothetical protein QUF75_07865 [Desulfococcaceae bacterium HSG7]|nr:hypothetical protein [Desulfococcaceae bacterium HSG7]